MPVVALGHTHRANVGANAEKLAAVELELGILADCCGREIFPGKRASPHGLRLGGETEITPNVKKKQKRSTTRGPWVLQSGGGKPEPVTNYTRTVH